MENKNYAFVFVSEGGMLISSSLCYYILGRSSQTLHTVMFEKKAATKEVRLHLGEKIWKLSFCMAWCQTSQVKVILSSNYCKSPRAE